MKSPLSLGVEIDHGNDYDDTVAEAASFKLLGSEISAITGYRS